MDIEPQIAVVVLISDYHEAQKQYHYELLQKLKAIQMTKQQKLKIIDIS
jgi:hypothetical protein